MKTNPSTIQRHRGPRSLFFRLVIQKRYPSKLFNFYVSLITSDRHVPGGHGSVHFLEDQKRPRRTSLPLVARCSRRGSLGRWRWRSRSLRRCSVRLRHAHPKLAAPLFLPTPGLGQHLHKIHGHFFVVAFPVLPILPTGFDIADWETHFEMKDGAEFLQEQAMVLRI